MRYAMVQHLAVRFVNGLPFPEGLRDIELTKKECQTWYCIVKKLLGVV